MSSSIISIFKKIARIFLAILYGIVMWLVLALLAVFISNSAHLHFTPQLFANAILMPAFLFSMGLSAFLTIKGKLPGTRRKVEDSVHDEFQIAIKKPTAPVHLTDNKVEVQATEPAESQLAVLDSPIIQPSRPAERLIDAIDETELFKVNGNKESILTPFAFLIFVAILIPFSAIKMPELIIISWPVLGVFLWMAFSLCSKSLQPWIVARQSRLELKLKAADNKPCTLVVPWENIKSFELSQPYKDKLIIKLIHSINVGSDKDSTSEIVISNEFYDIDPDVLLNKLSTRLNPSISSDHPYKYISNSLPLKERIFNSFIAIILFLYASYGVINNDLPLPTKRTPWHLHGIAMWIMCAALILAAANYISWVVDHYDQRDNERQYRTFRAYAKVTGYLFFGIALVYAVFQ
jgi:hypothetical protein